jgi:hypothetical protein
LFGFILMFVLEKTVRILVHNSVFMYQTEREELGRKYI